MKKDCPVGSYLVLKSKHVVPRERPLITISYMYNMRKVLSIIVTEYKGITKSGIPYLSEYPDPFDNVSIFPVFLPL